MGLILPLIYFKLLLPHSGIPHFFSVLPSAVNTANGKTYILFTLINSVLKRKYRQLQEARMSCSTQCKHRRSLPARSIYNL
jgi:hypothetical protein